MSSQIITPPDKILSPHSYLVINAVDNDVDTLVLWLKTVPELYDIHLWHVQMPDSDMWLFHVISGVSFILVNQKYERFLPPNVQRVLSKKTNRAYFGEGTESPELIQWFLRSRIEKI